MCLWIHLRQRRFMRAFPERRITTRARVVLDRLKTHRARRRPLDIAIPIGMLGLWKRDWVMGSVLLGERLGLCAVVSGLRVASLFSPWRCALLNSDVVAKCA